MDDLHKLNVLLYTEADTYVDNTLKAFDYGRDPFALPLEDGGYLYLGRRKPFAAVYVEMEPDLASSVDTTLAAQYYAPTANLVFGITFPATPASGSFKLDFGDGSITGALAHDIDAPTLQTDLRALTYPGTGGITITGSVAAGFTCTFIGANLSTPTQIVPTLTANSLLTAGSATVTPAIAEGALGGWLTLALPVEDTDAFQRSGFIKWENPVDTNSASLWGSLAVDGATKFWIRLQPAADITAATKVRGLNIVFADDNDLAAKDFGIRLLLPTDENKVRAASHILSHVTAREEIIKRLRQAGQVRQSQNIAAAIEAIDEWDLLEVGQIREAAVMMALANIYFNAADDDKGAFWAKYKRWESAFTQAMQLYILTIDYKDTGTATGEEKGREQSGGRIVRR